MNNKVTRIQRLRLAPTGIWLVATIWMTLSGLTASAFADDLGANRPARQDAVIESKQIHLSTTGSTQARMQQKLNLPTDGADAKSQSAATHNATEMALPARGKSRTGPQSAKTATRGSLVNLAISLGLVLAVFFGLAWLLRRVNPSSAKAGIPHEVVQVLGRAPLNGRQSMQLVRLGDKILLLAMSQAGTEPLGEITDRDEVDAITEICRSRNQNKIAESFRETLTRVRRDRMTGQTRNVLSRNT